jgi:hypothetical protein
MTDSILWLVIYLLVAVLVGQRLAIRGLEGKVAVYEKHLLERR